MAAIFVHISLYRFKENNMKTLTTDKELYRLTCEENFKNGNFCILRYEKQMDYLFNKLKTDFNTKDTLFVLDACCGYGRLLYYMNQFNSKQNYLGIDYSEDLITKGKDMFKEASNISFDIQDITNLPDKYTKRFDITINYKTLSWLPYYDECVKQLIKVTKNKIYITSLFNDNLNETLAKIYKNSYNSQNYTYLNTYSFEKFRDFCIKNGAKEVLCNSMHLDFDLKKSNDKNEISTYTELLATGERVEITCNTLLNWKLIEIIL